MSFLSKRFTAPALTVLAVAAVPLVAPMTADAALGGAKPLTSTSKPSLRSATIITPPDVTTTSIARICFDKAIDTVNNSELRVGIYRTDSGFDMAAPFPSGTTLQAESSLKSSPECVDATFRTPSLDPYTYISAGIGAVFTAGVANVADATTLIGATTQNGTTGRTTGPDLTGVSRVDTAAGRQDVVFAFDQNLTGTTPTASGFHVVDANGDDKPGATIISVSGKTVRVQFPVLTASSVRAYADPNTVQALDGNDPNTLISLPLPGSGGSTTSGGSTLRPDLQTVSVTQDGGSVDYRFDENIKAPDSNSFFVTLSDGKRIQVNPSSTILNGDTVRATIPGGSSKNEYIVNAYALDGAVTRTGPRPPGAIGDTSTAGGLNAGDNAGARAQGFTTGPEALSVTFNAAAGTASILLDQRTTNALLGQFRLLDGAGNEIASNATFVSGNTSTTAQRVTAVVTFSDPATVGRAAAIQLLQGAFTTSTGAVNPTQVLAP